MAHGTKNILVAARLGAIYMDTGTTSVEVDRYGKKAGR